MIEPLPGPDGRAAIDGWRVALLLHPLTLSSILLLALNDAVLKQAAPGLVTGKLSDVAGVWMIGSLMVAATGRPVLGASLTGVSFAGLKTIPTVAGWAAPVLGGTTLTDHSDLFALVILIPLLAVARQVRMLSTRRFIGLTRDTRNAALIVVLASVGFTTTATSCDTKPEVAEMQLTSDGDLIVSVQHTSADDGWYAVSLNEPPMLVDHAGGGIGSGRTSCLEDRCYTVVPREGFYAPDGEVLVSVADIGHDRGQCIQTEPFSSVLARTTDHGDEVWVGMGVDGLIVLTPDGRLQQVDLPGLLVSSIQGVRPDTQPEDGDGPYVVGPPITA